MNKYELFTSILRHSKEYKMDGSVLTLIDYNTGERVEIDLGEIDEEMFEQIDSEPEEYDEEEW